MFLWQFAVKFDFGSTTTTQFDWVVKVTHINTKYWKFNRLNHWVETDDWLLLSFFMFFSLLNQTECLLNRVVVLLMSNSAVSPDDIIISTHWLSICNNCNNLFPSSCTSVCVCVCTHCMNEWISWWPINCSLAPLVNVWVTQQTDFRLSDSIKTVEWTFFLLTSLWLVQRRRSPDVTSLWMVLLQLRPVMKPQVQWRCFHLPALEGTMMVGFVWFTPLNGFILYRGGKTLVESNNYVKCVNYDELITGIFSA